MVLAAGGLELLGLGEAGVVAVVEGAVLVVEADDLARVEPGGLSLRPRPIECSLTLTSSIDLLPKLRMSSRSASERETSSPTEWMPSRLRQL